MIGFSLVVLGLVFILLCVFLVLLVLIQPGKSSSGMGGLGGGSAASAIGETLGASHGEKTLSRWTEIGMGAFFGLCLLLTILGNMQQTKRIKLGSATPTPAADVTTPSVGAPDAATGELKVELPAIPASEAPAPAAASPAAAATGS